MQNTKAPNTKAPNRTAPQTFTLESLFKFDFTNQKYGQFKFLKDYGYNVIE